MTTPHVTPILWIGSLSATRSAVHKHIVDIVSSCKGCAKCYFCRSLNDVTLTSAYGVPPCVIWLMPRDHGYVREQVDESLAMLTVELDVHEASAIVMQSVEQFNSSTANRLLKIIEEPPAGWHIILTTERPEEVLPTVRSRCIEIQCSQELSPESGVYAGRGDALPSAVMMWLENPHRSEWLEMCEKIDELPKTVPGAVNALDRLIKLWHARWIEGTDPRSQAMLTILTQMAETPPKAAEPTASGGFCS